MAGRGAVGRGSWIIGALRQDVSSPTHFLVCLGAISFFVELMAALLDE